MSGFGLSFDGPPSTRGITPPKHVSARITLGAFSEGVFCDVSIWSVQQYLDHWKLTAAECLATLNGGSFCSSLSRNGASLWVGLRRNDSVIFHNTLTPKKLLGIRGLLITTLEQTAGTLEEPLSKRSEWSVPIREIEHFVQQERIG